MSERITAMDVERQQFKRKVRGFDPEEVILFLRSVSGEIERLNLQNATLLEENGRLKAAVKEHATREQTLQQTLVTAQKMSEELKERSQAQADQVMYEARIKAERTLQETQDQLARLEAEIARAKLDRDLFETRLENTVEEHLKMLEQRRSARKDAPDNVRPIRPSSRDAAGFDIG
jgi:cell division initiation protein